MRSDRGTQRGGAIWTRSEALRLLAFFFIAAFLAFSAAPALAAKTHRLITTFDAGSPAGVAVDEDSGNVFVVDALGPAVDIFGPEGGVPSGIAPPYKIQGVGVAEGGLAVDNSATSPSKGALYLAESHSTVKKFALNPVSEKYELKGELSASPAIVRAYSVAVDSKGDVFVGDDVGKAVVEFGPTGAQIARLDLSASIGSPFSVAVDSAGDLFVTAGAVYRFDANGAGEIEPGTEPVQIVKKKMGEGPRPGSLAVDLGTDDLYVGMDHSELVPRHVDQYSASCTPVSEGGEEHCLPEGEFGSGAFIQTRAVAVNSKTGYVYVADPSLKSNGHRVGVSVFGPTLIVPGSTTGAATAVTGTAATLNGTVDPSGSEVNECKFEYGVETSPGDPGDPGAGHPPVPPSFAYTHTTPCAESPAQIGAGNAPVAVHADIAGLGLGTKYHFRLLATSATTVPNEKGPSVGADKAFITLGPQVHAESVSAVSDTAAKLEGLVNPEGQATSYVFEYVSQADFEESEYAKATSVPLGGEEIGSGGADVKVAQQLTGLSPSTAYRFRIAATNISGIAHGPDRTFATYAAPQAFSGCPNEILRDALGSTSLSDCRAYEQVTPLDKNGAGPSGAVGEVEAAVGGDGIVYLSGAGIPGSEGSQQYPTYLSSRGSDWSTQGLLPPASAGSSAAVLGWSEDLARAYVVQADLPGDPANFLQRDNATHALRPIAAEGKDSSSFIYLGASADGLTVFFESDTPLPPGGAVGTKVFNTYAWDASSGELSLAGVLNNGLPPAKGSLAGANEKLFHSSYTQALHTVSSDGSRVFFRGAASDQIYVRQNPTLPQSELVAGKCSEPELACTVQVSASKRTAAPLKDEKPSTFWGATPDGSRAFFTSPGKLTDDATTGPKDEGADLYRYDLEGEELIDLTPDSGDPNGADVQGVFGASNDGSYAYFAANGVLAAGATPGNCVHGNNVASFGSGTCNIYLWHEGTITFIAPLRMPSTVWSSGIQNSDERTSRVSVDGQALLFDSELQLSAYDNRGTREFYRYSASENKLSCVSCNPTGAAPAGLPRLRSITKYGETIPNSAFVLTRNLSADGNRIFFETSDKLLAADTNGDAGCPPSVIAYCQDVYEWEAKGSGSCQSEAQNGGCLYLLSTGTSAEPAYFGDASASGNDAFIYTTESLVGQDQDQIVDIYDARVGGGIAAQNPPLPRPACEAEACKPATPPPPAAQSPGSASFSGPPNPKPSHHKKKKHQRKKQQHKKRHAAGKQR
jgi:sugar lactone lactonase YvrE